MLRWPESIWSARSRCRLLQDLNASQLNELVRDLPPQRDTINLHPEDDEGAEGNVEDTEQMGSPGPE